MKKAAASSVVLALILAACGGGPSKTAERDPDATPDPGTKIKRASSAYVDDWVKLSKFKIPPGEDSGFQSLHVGWGASLHQLALRAGKSIALHHHAKCDETVIVIEGSGAITLGGGGRVPIAAGQVALIPRGVGHGFAADAIGDLDLRALLVCAPEVFDIAQGDGPEHAKIEAFDLEKLTSQPLTDAGPGLVKKEIARGPNESVHVIRTRERIPLHQHASHDEITFVFDGHGTCRIGDPAGGEVPYPTQGGTILHIPAGWPHAVEHFSILRGGEHGPDTRALVIYAPPFDATDFVPIRDAKSEAPKTR